MLRESHTTCTKPPNLRFRQSTLHDDAEGLDVNESCAIGTEITNMAEIL
jgi:hypothetical protein